MNNKDNLKLTDSLEAGCKKPFIFTELLSYTVLPNKIYCPHLYGVVPELPEVVEYNLFALLWAVQVHCCSTVPLVMYLTSN